MAARLNRTQSCIVLAGGWSVRPEHLQTLNAVSTAIDIICVNDAAKYIDSPDCVVTMDRKWFINRYAEMHARAMLIYYRRCATKGLPVPIDGYHCAFANNNLPGAMSNWTVPFRLDGNNSGACALNLAFLRRYARVFLLGFDMCKGPQNENHFYPDYPWNINATKPAALAGWAGSFKEAAHQFELRGIRVFNVNDRSLIRDFPIISFEQFRSQVA